MVNQSEANIEEIVKTESQNQEVITEKTENEIELKQENKTTEDIVREYFIDTPVMADIAFCESTFRQFDKNGQVLRGLVNGADVGVMQINETYHAETAAKLGIDIHTLEGNMEYGMYLYETQGTDPWVHSKDCWNTVREIAIN